ncbi:hypothetical protein FACS1894178_0390 [Bacteroidia bacterium]|nr:hypothetical protein FACS1894178_0390 [Bacteroidia bacterium]
MSIYPNPANDYITIASTNNVNLDNCMLEIYDVYGRVCVNKKINSSEGIDVSFLKKGYYLIKLMPQNKKAIHSIFIKQ